MLSMRAVPRLARGFASKEGGLARRRTRFENAGGAKVELDAVYEDTMPAGSSVGTVVSLHGAPGSHLDFKYIRPLLDTGGIRHVGVNYPGFGVTKGDHLLRHNNAERHGFVNALMDELDLHEKVVTMGHSRGTENALMLAADRKTRGVVLLNPTGLSMHRGIKPFWALQTMTRLYDLPIPGLRAVLHPLFWQLYQILKLKAASGEIAAVCMKAMATVALGEQKKYIDTVNDNQTKVLFAYAGKDWLIENEISEHCARSFADIQHLVGKGASETDNRLVTEQTVAAMNGKGASVFFEEDAHFLQKSRASLIASAIEAMLNDTSSQL